MVTRDIKSIVFLAFVLFSLTSCDSAEITDPPSPQDEVMPLQTRSPEFVQAQRQLDASLLHAADVIPT
jgi:hypothetical protein